MKDTERRWEPRIERARTLRGDGTMFTAAMRLYHATLEVQREVSLASTSFFRSELSLRNQIDIRFAASHMPAVLRVVLEHGPEKLRVRARALQNEGESGWQRLLEAYLDSESSDRLLIDDYFVRSCVQPLAENLQCQSAADRNYSQSVCPACGGLPQLAVLRPEGEGASRSLQCSFCLREWLFRRIVCPFCGEEDKEKLPRYRPEQCNYVHVESCDTCMHYLKAVDMSIEGHAVPLIDEAAWAVLDVWASDRGYTKIIPNLVGF